MTGEGLELGAEGIQVIVGDNTTTTFHGTAALAGLTSKCSGSSIVYTEVTAAPPPPPPPPPPGEGGGGQTPGGGTVVPAKPPTPNPPGKPPAPALRTIPAGMANDNTPTITGKAVRASVVQIFGSAGCKGPALAEGSAAQFSTTGIDVQVANDTVLTFYGISIDAGGDRSACSEEAVIFVEDSTAPITRITSGPGAKTRRKKVVFRFADLTGGYGTSFICRVDRRKWRACTAPLKLKKLGHRRHVIKVKGIDAAGNEEQAVAKRSFKVIR